MDEANGAEAKKLVLVIDDDEQIRLVLQRHLQRLGYAAVSTSSAEEGVALTESLNPVAILCDVYMPQMDGHAFLSRVNALGMSSGVVLMSGRGQLDDVIGALREGAVDYLKKPWTDEEVARVVSRAVALHEALCDEPGDQDMAPRVPARTKPGRPGATVDPGDVARGLLATPTRALPLITELADSLRWLAQLWDQDLAKMDVAAAMSKADPTARDFLRMVSSSEAPGEVNPSGNRTDVGFVGAEALGTTLEARALHDVFPLRGSGPRALHERIWRFATARGLAMQELASIADPELGLDRSECFHVGVLLDVGASYFLAVVDAEDGRKRRAGTGEPRKLLSTLVECHAELSGRLLREWGLPVEIETLGRSHHATGDERAPSALACAVALGGALATRTTGFGDPTGDRLLSADHLARCAYTLGVGDTGLRRLGDILGKRATRTWAAVERAVRR